MDELDVGRAGIGGVIADEGPENVIHGLLEGSVNGDQIRSC